MSATVIPSASVAVELEDLTLDRICFDHAHAALRDRRMAGRLRGYVEATLEANPGLSAGVVLPRGIRVNLPEFVIETETAIVRLWD